MSSGSDWFEQLESRLEQQLEAFLRANPQQAQRLEQQAQKDRRQAQQKREQERLMQADSLRRDLLRLADEIRSWRERTDRARQAGATELANRAQQQVDQLMEQGRQRWQTLAALGEELNVDATNAAARPPSSNEPLEQAWARFETEQELEALRRRQR
jgi:hercynine metabolism protein